jgi:hypothetical protein
VPKIVNVLGWHQETRSPLFAFGFTTTCATSTYHHKSCKFEPCSWRGVLDTTLCDKVCQWLVTGQWFSPGTSVSSTNKTAAEMQTRFYMFYAIETKVWHTCIYSCIGRNILLSKRYGMILFLLKDHCDIRIQDGTNGFKTFENI